ncbi:hypothetical protein [Sandaracinus amylolyticus]|uniref:Uncharacterized protein n=1 Tax=Sandaracinus amylolyticus TaxID=927083 RepID=A0A0F6W346_9BACT|nr:hypothetical protein [Sandaracinus amylolyticus]AKF06058.1 hypothetical protein DB32_003207 [Sandaracinus amylolyticus]
MTISIATMTTPSDRQSQPPSPDEGDVPRARKKFAAALRRRIVEDFNVPEREAARWLAKKMGVRWQTAQFWLEGQSFPLGINLTKLGEAVGMTFAELVGPMADDQEPQWPSWREFLATPEGQSTTDPERWALRLFPWTQPPTVGDYRSLLAVVRQNAERG